ncbi:MAG TPA: aminoglycoside phosphotransferase family protein [Kiritimatiellia bacterium]|nr:aminoglycoside phosphotransferase family protein [Kiritimatiellia bacterium]HRU70625.1 aminoglycoside phosphotransferase family protein [Kiritimatiellia bacterium]
MSTARIVSQDVLRGVFEGFQAWGDFVCAEPYGSGHINDTYRVRVNLAGTPAHYLLQRINHHIFKHPEGVMENIVRVTGHLRAKMAGAPDASRRTLTVIPARADGRPWVRDEAGNWWRLYLFIERARTYDVIENERQAFEAARAFARFQSLLADLPAPRLHETIPAFHNTLSRLEVLDAAIKADAFGRKAEVEAEIAFVEKRRARCGHLLERHMRGEIPERITHNDTKINNVMLDDATGEGVCVIDLDTVMPGLALYDFGDMVRSATAAAREDERDLSKVGSRIEMFAALARGYLEGAAEFLLPAEREELVFSGQLITLTIGIRFLTDYLSGDVYFRTRRPGQNLDRCRTQFQMVRSMEAQAAKMEAIVRETGCRSRSP